jgi:hypothetical protein
MAYTKYLSFLSYFILCVLGLYTFYVGVIEPPFRGYYTIDESYVADGGVFLWYGMTPRCLDWPATPSVLQFYLLFSLSTLQSLIANFGDQKELVSYFNQFDLNAYNYLMNREPLLLVGRTVQLILVLFFVFLTVFFLQQRGKKSNGTLAGILSILVVTSYLIWFNAPFLRPEALAGTVFLYIFVQLVFSTEISKNQLRVLSLLFAAVIAQRLLFAFLSPIFFLGLFFRLPTDRFKGMLHAVGIVLICFIALCPFFITDPFVMGKAFFGGILAKMNDKPMETFFNMNYISNYFSDYTGYLLVALALVGTFSFLAKREAYNWIVIANWLFFLFLVLRSPKIYDTHVLPAAVIMLVMIGYGIDYVRSLTGKFGWGAVAIICVVIGGNNILRFVKFQKEFHEVTNEQNLTGWLESQPNDTRFLLPVSAELDLPKNEAMLNRRILQNSNADRMAGKLNYLLGKKGNDKIADAQLPIVAKNNIFEDEMMYDLQYKLLKKHRSLTSKSFDYDIYLDNIELVNHGISYSQAMSDFRDGKYDLLVTEKQLEGTLVPWKEFRGKRGAPFYVYKYQN